MNSTYPFSGLTMGLFIPFGLEFSHKVCLYFVVLKIKYLFSILKFENLSLKKKFGYKRQVIVCTIFFSLCALTASFIKSYLAFILIYGLGSGVFTGIVYLVPYYIAYM